ncbi:hypothetical protein CSUI_007239, partial [Cystoisospora suis]
MPTPSPLLSRSCRKAWPSTTRSLGLSSHLSQRWRQGGVNVNLPEAAHTLSFAIPCHSSPHFLYMISLSQQI